MSKKLRSDSEYYSERVRVLTKRKIRNFLRDNPDFSIGPDAQEELCRLLVTKEKDLRESGFFTNVMLRAVANKKINQQLDEIMPLVLPAIGRRSTGSPTNATQVTPALPSIREELEGAIASMRRVLGWPFDPEEDSDGRK